MAGPQGKSYSATVGSTELTLSTGRYAKQSAGSVLAQYGDTTVMVNANAQSEPRDLPFLPLTVNYEEKLAAGGRIPGSFFRREGRPTERETLLCRIIDRSIRPLFDSAWRCETQVVPTVFAFDGVNDPDATALTATSAALCISDIPFAGPIAGVRVGQIDGELIVNPTIEQRETGDLDVFVAASKDAILMVEGGGKEVDEELMVEVLKVAKDACLPLIEMQEKMVADLGRTKRTAVKVEIPEAIVKAVAERAAPRLAEAFGVGEKHARYAALDAVKEELLAAFAEEVGEEKWADEKPHYKAAFGDAKSNYMRRQILETKKRIGGRGPSDIRDIWCEVGLLPRNHGSACFTRGETQSIVSCTLGTERDEQRIEGLSGMFFKSFMLHYNFPPYSVGEVKRMGGTSRREIGHGTLAMRALEGQLPGPDDDFPYTIRVVSEIMESNGSSSMASVCGGTLAMQDCGVPMKAPVAGIAMGLIMEGDDYVVLSDILGDEDHLGDMDFKVCGTAKGITAIQMDIKCPGLTFEILASALTQAKEGRLHILGEMAKTLEAPRPELSRWAPRIETVKIKVERIKDIIGPGGKIIRDISKRTNTQINVEDDGTVKIASAIAEDVEAAIKIVRELTQEPELDKVYLGTVRRIMDFGAFVEILPGTDGLLHISEIAHKRIEQVEDVLHEGDEVMVKVLSIDRGGKIRLSRRAALDEAKKDEGAKKDEDAKKDEAKAEAPAN